MASNEFFSEAKGSAHQARLQPLAGGLGRVQPEVLEPPFDRGLFSVGWRTHGAQQTELAPAICRRLR